MECKDNFPKNRMLWLLVTIALFGFSYWLPEPEGGCPMKGKLQLH